VGAALLFGAGALQVHNGQPSAAAAHVLVAQR
jgi:hypothetical protein